MKYKTKYKERYEKYNNNISFYKKSCINLILLNRLIQDLIYIYILKKRECKTDIYETLEDLENNKNINLYIAKLCFKFYQY